MSKTSEIIYKVNAGIPFRWEYKIEDESIVKFVKKYVSRNDNIGAISGAPIYTNYVFEGLKKGQTKIIFQYYNFADKYLDDEEIYIATVDSNKNIEISKINK